jgi:hypothetical protein
LYISNKLFTLVIFSAELFVVFLQIIVRCSSLRRRSVSAKVEPEYRTQFAQWMGKLNIGVDDAKEYTSNFEQEGYNDPESLHGMSAIDMQDKFHVKEGHAKRLWVACEAELDRADKRDQTGKREQADQCDPEPQPQPEALPETKRLSQPDFGSSALGAFPTPKDAHRASSAGNEQSGDAAPGSQGAALQAQAAPGRTYLPPLDGHVPAQRSNIDSILGI